MTPRGTASLSRGGRGRLRPLLGDPDGRLQDAGGRTGRRVRGENRREGAPRGERGPSVIAPHAFRSARPEPRRAALLFAVYYSSAPMPATSAAAPAAPTLFVVDGYALIYRAFCAMIARPLRTTRGENTSAAWGVTNFLLRLLEQHRPERLGWVHDVGTSFRQETYPAYKATRQKLSEELQQDFDRSVERIAQLLAAFGVPLVGVEGYEADDVIGTLATHAAGAGFRVVIVSGDKDFYQLIGPNVVLLNPGRGGPAAVEEQWVDEANASDRLGVPPARVVDYLALVGDSSDNIPGVKGVGDKTALELIQAYGDLDDILARAAEIRGKRAREALLTQVAEARLSRDLVTIRRDVPLPLELDALRVRAPDLPRLTQLFTELEFRSLIPRLDRLGAAPPAPPARPPPQTPPAPPPAPPPVAPAAPAPGARIVDDAAGIAAVVAAGRTAPVVALGTETTSPY